MAAVLFTYWILISHTLRLITCYSFNADEFKSLSYEVDIGNKPVLSGESLSGLVIHLSSKYGQQYQCSLPDSSSSLEEMKLANIEQKDETKLDVSALLKPLANQPCLTKTKDWWTYKFCYGKSIKQYHTEDSKLVSPVILLGAYDSEFDWKSEYDSNVNNLNRARRYHSQYYVNGSKCDVTGALRKTEVRFVCEEGAADFISHVDEPESCQYVIVINTNRVCPHPLLQPPPSGKPKSITCNPVLSSDNYQQYQKEQEDEKKRMEEMRKKWLAKQEKRLTQMKQENDADKKNRNANFQEIKITDEGKKEFKAPDKSSEKVAENVKTKYQYYEEEDEKFYQKLEEMEVLLVDLSKSIDLSDNSEGERVDEDVYKAYKLFFKIVNLSNNLNEYMENVFTPRWNEIKNSVSEIEDASDDIAQSLKTMGRAKPGENDQSKLKSTLANLEKLSKLQGKSDQLQEQTKFHENLLDKIQQRYIAATAKIANFNLKLLDMAEEDLDGSDKNLDKFLNILKKKNLEMIDTIEKKSKKSDQEDVSTLKASMEMESSDDLKSNEKLDVDEDADKIIAAATKSAIDAIENTLGVKFIVESIGEDADAEDNQKFRLVDNNEIQSAINRLLTGDESIQHLQHLSNLERNYKFVWRSKKSTQDEEKE
ncbi:Protein OS-9 [Chamberlinius hualienensis]